MAKTKDEIIESATENPRRVTGDYGSLEQHNIKDLNDVLDRKTANEVAQACPARGVIFSRFRHGPTA